MQAEDSRHEVPAANALGHGTFDRRTPHIYRPDEIAKLMQAAARLKPASSIRPVMYSTLLGLLAATGMRISEALALRLDDVTADGLIIRQTKFQKSRLLPLHETTQRALDKYLAVRIRLGTLDHALLVSTPGKAPSYPTVVARLFAVARSIGLRGNPGQPGPRIHDLRHTFAVRSLEQCPRDREAVARHVVALSTYLGHAHVTDTYWYLHATPILMGQIAEAGEALHRGRALMTALATHLAAFLREHLPHERKASPHTCATYAYSFQLLVCFAARQLKVKPCQLEIEQLDAPLVLAFLEAHRDRTPQLGPDPQRPTGGRQLVLPLPGVSAAVVP